MSVNPVAFTEEKVGKRIKASKKKYSWSLKLNNQDYIIDLYLSKLTKKVKVLVNNEISHTGKLTKNVAFQFSTEALGHKINLIQQGKIFDLRIDSVSFDYLLMQSKTKTEFTYEFEEPKLEPEPVKVVETPVIKSNNPFEDLFDEPKEEKKDPPPIDQQPKKLKPFSIKPPQAFQTAKPQGIFEAPVLQQERSSLQGDLFANPSKPSKSIGSSDLPLFPEASNPFRTGPPGNPSSFF